MVDQKPVRAGPPLRGACSRYDPVIIGLRFSDRAKLYRRIDTRVDRMLAEGLLEETERLWRAGVFDRSRTAAQAIGYKELLGYLRGEVTLDEAVEKLKQSTRRYAKRQLTWFRANPDINWIEADGKTGDEIADEAALIWERACKPEKGGVELEGAGHKRAFGDMRQNTCRPRNCRACGNSCRLHALYLP